MAKEDVSDLLPFLEAFEPNIRAIALELRNRVWDQYAESNELIYDGPAALAFGWSLSDRAASVFLSIAIYNNKGVLFGFLKGAGLTDPLGLLEGKGKHYRYIRVDDLNAFPQDYAFDLLRQSYENALRDATNMNEGPSGGTIIKSASAKKRRPSKPV